MVDADGTLPLPWLGPPLAAALAQAGHALLVVGSPGGGAFELLTTLAQSRLCEADRSPGRLPIACGVCVACRLARAGTHPDLRMLLPETLRVALGGVASDVGEDGAGGGAGRRRASRQIRIQEVREAIDWVHRTASRGRAKVLLVHPAEALNPQSANALLKTLEEPPSGSRIVLSATDPDRLLPTVRSRCQRVVLPVPDALQAVQWLEASGIGGADAARVLLAAAAGRPLDALALHRDGIDAGAWSALPQALRDGRVAAWSGWPVARAVDSMLKLCHDLTARAAGAGPRYFPPQAVPADADLATLAEWGRTLARVERQAEHPWNEPLLLDALVSQGRQALATLTR